MKAVAVALLVLSLAPLPSTAKSVSGAAVQIQPSAPNGAASSSGQSAAATTESLLHSTLGLDIDTASYYELVAWCRRLSLPDTGTKPDLQARLRAYYHIAAPAAGSPTTKSTGERLITIESADSAEYFTIEKVNQKYIRLSGGVSLKMYDPKTDSTHSIRADTILFNQDEKTITATGHLEYFLTGKGKTEEFRGESLTFNVDDWAGIFFSGISQSQKKIGDNNLTFYYSGKKIERSADDVVTLSAGTITSSDALAPNYKIDASRIWVLAPGEWALQNAVLYIGRIPILYLPFFFHPGDELVFNPALGYRQEEGFYLQTTTYLLGRKSTQAGTLSFLQIAEDTNQKYNTTLDGLFLRKTTPESQSTASKTPYNEDESYVRLLGDVYSRLGVFGGLQSKFADFGALKSGQLDLGIARSRNIYVDPLTGGYTQFWEQPDGTFASGWNDSNLLGVDVPLRYGVNLNLNAQNPVFTVTAALPFYSDPYFVRDFGNRAESIDWSQLLGINQTPETLATSQAALSQIQSSLLWSLHLGLSPDPGTLKPWVSSVALTNADLSAYWKTKALATTGVAGLDPTLPGYIPSSAASDFFFPQRQFFYPDTIVLPSLAGRVSGTLLGAPAAAAPAPRPSTPASTQPSASSPGDAAAGAQRAQVAAAPEKPPEEIAALPPWAGSTKKEQGPVEGALRTPELRGDIAIPAPTSSTDFSQSLGYTIQPNFSIEDHTVSDSWQSPSDISLGSAYSILSTRGTGTLQYSGSLFDNFATLADAITLSGNYKNHYNQSSAISASDWQSFLAQDYASTFLKVTNAITITNRPFVSIDSLSASQLTYSLTSDLYSHDYLSGVTAPTYDDLFLPWNPTHVTTHSLGLNLSYAAPWNQAERLTLNATLPPLLPEIDGTGVAMAGPLTTTVTGSATQPTGSTSWLPKPLTVDELFAPADWLTLEEALSYDFALSGWSQSVSKGQLSFFDGNLSLAENFTYDLWNNLPLDSITTFRLWYLNAQFEAERTNRYTFVPGSGWIQRPALEFLPSTLTVGLAYSYSSQPLWKNRITFSTNVNGSWNVNLLQFTQNSFDLTFNAKLSIYQFLDVTFSSETQNAATYRYLPGLPEQIGQTQLNPLTDLFDSINFFNVNDRIASNFKMKSIALNLVHHLGDWDLTIQYSGSPQLATTGTGASVYQWTPTLSLLVQWRPVPEIKTTVTYQPNQTPPLSF